MPKKKMMEKSFEEVKEMLQSDTKPFSSIEKFVVVGDKLVRLVPCCLMCEQPLPRHAEAFVTGVWVWEENKRNYLYALCLDCFKKYSNEKNIEKIEDKIMLLITTRPHIKG